MSARLHIRFRLGKKKCAWLGATALLVASGRERRGATEVAPPWHSL